VHYPPLFSDGGAGHGFNHGVIDNIVIINAYDGMTTTPGSGSEDVKISNSTMWAHHHLFNLTNTGDSWAFSNNRFTPGPLLNTCRFSEPCEAAINEANYSNANFHIMAGGAVTLVVSSVETFSWRYGILIDSGGLLGGSLFDVAWDGMGTLMIPAQAACMRSRTTSQGPCQSAVLPSMAAILRPATHRASIWEPVAGFLSMIFARMGAWAIGWSAPAETT
jgi:hypothetical protein